MDTHLDYKSVKVKNYVMEDTLRLALIALASLLVLPSCAWYRNLERSLVADDAKQERKNQPVSRQQYDELLVKYEELSKKYETLKEGRPAQSSLVDELQNTASAGGNGQTETVDLFAGKELPSEAPADLESQLALYRRGQALRASNAGEATKIFQQLEANGAPAVKPRAKLQIGEMLLGKQQYDLALQVFEDVIHKHANSGVVLEALKYAVICCDKLNIANKKDQYTSMLTDVFEAN
jgi:hypothetical protein